jgi:hypothetical protein
MNDTATESTALVLAKLAPPASVTVATMAGMQISEVVLWATLVYTILLICHKLFAMYSDARTWWLEQSKSKAQK